METDEEAEMEMMKKWKWKWMVMVRGMGDETEWRRVLVEVRDLLRGISRRLDQLEESLDGIDKRLDQMEGVEEELLEGERKWLMGMEMGRQKTGKQTGRIEGWEKM